MQNKNIFRYLVLFVFGNFLITSCGGGGGGGGSSNSTPVFTLNPATINLQQGEGESQSFSVTATPNVSFSGSVYIFIVDNSGVIQPNVTITPNGNNTYTATLNTSTSLTAGVHTGNIELRACGDAACNSQYPGSPMNVPYTIEVMSSTNLTTLSPWTTVAEWGTLQRDNSHSGYVPVTLNSVNFSPRWRWVATESGNKLSPVVAANGIVYVASSGYFATTSMLYALNESDNSLVWNQDFGAIYKLNDPAVSGGNVYVATSGHSDTYMWSYTADNGTFRFSTAFNSQWDNYYAPTIDSGIVYTDGGYYGGMNAFNTSDGSNVWFTGLNQYDQWSPVVDANYAYAYLSESCSGCNNAGLQILNKTTGAIVNTINDPNFNWTGWSMQSSPSLGSMNDILAVSQANSYYSNQLVSFDLTNLKINWATTGIYRAQPALAKDVIYIANNLPLRLEARDEASGSLIWSWSPTSSDETGFVNNVVVTDNIVFVSTNKRIHAIDITTHDSIWTYWKPGPMAISNSGILYVSTTDGGTSNGALVAINLQ